MAGNMQPMGGPGGMMPQQQQQQFLNSANGNVLKGQMQNFLVQALKACPPPPGGPTWHTNLVFGERLTKAMSLATNVYLAQQAGNNIDIARLSEFAAKFEREQYHKAPSKEAWIQAMDAKSNDFYQKRVQNAQNLQQELNQNYNHVQAQAQQQAMMGMQFVPQMGRGMGPSGFQQMQRPAQMPNMQAQQQRQQQQQQFRPQQQQQQQQPQQFQQQQQQFPQQFQQQQQLPMGMANNMGNQGAPAMGQNSSMMGMQQNRQFLMQDIAKLAPQDKNKVNELAAKMMSEASTEKKQQAFNVISQRIAPEQIQRLQQTGQNPMQLYFQQQAFQVLRANAQSAQARQPGQGQQGQQGQQGSQQNPNAGQAPMMQQQASRQSFQQRPNMTNPQAANDFSQQFSNNSNMDSIIDQQMKGFMAQENGQPVVPATSSRPPSSQPMAASMSNQNQNQNQTPRPPQQQPQQQPTPQQQTQQQQLAMQMRMGQQNQQNQAQLHPQSQMQQPGPGPSQSPGMGTLNTPVARPVNGMDQMNGQGMQGFGGQPFKQAMQTNPNLMNAFMNAIPPEQRQQVHNMSQEQLQMVIHKWQSARRENLQGQQNQMQNQMQNRPPSQVGQANGNMPNANMNGQPVQGMQPQMGQPNGFNQQRAQPPTPPTSQAQAMMDSMDLPPNLVQQETFKNMPQEVRKWKDLRAWLGQNPSAIPPNVRGSLGAIQHRQFQAIMQKRMQDKVSQGQNPNMGQNMGIQGHPQPTPQAQTQAQTQPPQQQLQQYRQQNMQRPMPNGVPPQVYQVSAAEIATIRQTQNGAAGATDEQLRAHIQRNKVQRWNAAPEAQRAHFMAQFQGQVQAQGQQAGLNGTAAPQPQVQQPTPTQTLATPQQAPMPTPNSAQTATAKQSTPAKAQTQANKNKKAAQPAQGGKNLKRPSADISADGGNNNAQQRKGSQQQAVKMSNAAASGEDNANVQSKRPEQKQASQQGSNADGSENLNRLRTIGQEEQKRFAQASMPDIQMSPQEYNVTADKLRRLVVDMGKIGRGLSKWYGISRDDDRARGFFMMRLRIIRQFLDGEKMEQPKPTFSINATELDKSRNMLEGMAREIAQHFNSNKGLNAQGQQTDAQNGLQASNTQEFANQQQRLISQKQQQQQRQQQQMQAQQAQRVQQAHAEQQEQAAPAPLNAANLEKNTQALKNQKAANKGAKAPSAPTTTQPPFQIGASSPHGNPNYIGKAKDMNLKLPAKKKAKLENQTGQKSQTATPSPNVTTKTPPVPQPQKPQEPLKPAVQCQDPECQQSIESYPNEEALQRHIQEEHVKPRQDPVKFLAENLALALGLEPNGSPKKDQKQGPPPATSRGASKQGASSLGTPKSEPGSMNRSASMQSKIDIKTKNAPGAPKTPFNAQALFAKLGYPDGISTVALDISVLRSHTPKDTPESAKDSGASEPNTELFDMPIQDYAMNWAWGTSNEDILVGPRIPWKQEYVLQPGDEELLQDANYKDVDWSDVSMWNTNMSNQMDTTGWNMEVA